MSGTLLNAEFIVVDRSGTRLFAVQSETRFVGNSRGLDLHTSSMPQLPSQDVKLASACIGQCVALCLVLVMHGILQKLARSGCEAPVVERLDNCCE